MSKCLKFYVVIHFPPHLICVATLPCKTQKFEISAQHSIYDKILYTSSSDSAR